MRGICFCNSNRPWGGGEKWHFETALAFAEAGWRVFLACHPQSILYLRVAAQGRINAVPLPVGRFSFLNPFLRWRLVRFFTREKIEAVIMNLPSDLKCFAPAAVQAKIKHVVYRRGSALPVADSRLNRMLFSRLSAVIVNSEETRRQLLLNNPRLIAREKIHLLPNTLDDQAFVTQLRHAGPSILPPKLADMEPGQRPFVLGSAGRFNKQKAQHYLLRLGLELKRRNFPFHLVLAGQGELESSLRRLAQEYGIAEQVSFPGFLEDLSPFWRDIDLFILTSLWEGFGYVLLEAMLAQKPVFAFSVSNIPDLVLDGINGRLFELPLPPDYAGLPEMAQAVLDLAENPSLAKRMGLAGQDFALEQFSREKYFAELQKLLCS